MRSLFLLLVFAQLIGYLTSGISHRGAQGHTDLLSYHTGVHRGYSGVTHTQGYTEGTQVVRRGAQGHTDLLRYHTGVHRGTQRYTGVLRYHTG